MFYMYVCVSVPMVCDKQAFYVLWEGPVGDRPFAMLCRRQKRDDAENPLCLGNGEKIMGACDFLRRRVVFGAVLLNGRFFVEYIGSGI